MRPFSAFTKTFETPSEAYLHALGQVLRLPDHRVEPRGQPCRELVNYQFLVERPSPASLVTRDETRNQVLHDYLIKETSLYLRGELRAEEWAKKASKFWAKLANPDGTINSNYGWLAFHDRCLPGGSTPWEWARDSLLEDRDTRQAYIKFAKRGHLWRGNRDQVCTLHMNFLVRDDRLHGTVVMRSCDIVKGLAYDMPWFCYLLLTMADDVGLIGGTYTHYCHSLHLYERDEAAARRMLGGTS